MYSPHKQHIYNILTKPNAILSHAFAVAYTSGIRYSGRYPRACPHDRDPRARVLRDRIPPRSRGGPSPVWGVCGKCEVLSRVIVNAQVYVRSNFVLGKRV
jgi:hypothetical protein